MSTPLTNINLISPVASETVRIPLARMEASVSEIAVKAPNQDSPFGPDYIVETKGKADSRPAPEAVKPPEPKPTRPEKPTVAGVVPFTATSGPGADLAALPPLEALGTETLTELSLNKLMQPSHQTDFLKETVG
ncbi:MAG: hypothetical protein IPK50_01010 [Fibrobacterota bacterium]|nr:hypothetical protein [Fibrobacterota bacterium]QQS05493.1 MAG: hypothetical protein IPK50_01010 [Fibrobacterota bacterium]